MSAKNDKPKSSEGVSLQDIGSEVLLYDSGRENVHILNPTALAIWNLCNGHNTLEDICRELLGRFSGVSSDDLMQDIEVTVAELRGKKLLT